MIATGFLRLGPSGGGTRQDALDDLVSTTSLTFMGLTVGCARCHNHKFDPIPQKDYYRHAVGLLLDERSEHPLAPAARSRPTAGDAARSTTCSGRSATKKRKIEAPYLQQILDREIAKLPEYMQIAWKTPPDKRTTGQKLNVDPDRTDGHHRHARASSSPSRTSSR